MTESKSCFKGSIKLLFVAFLVFIGGFFLGQSVSAPNKTQQHDVTSAETTELVVYKSVLDYGNGRVDTYTISGKAGITVFEILKQVTSQNNITVDSKYYEGMGYLITQIGDKKNGDDNKYWQYTVNNVMATVSADTYVLENKDNNIIKWKFAEFHAEE